MSLIQCEFVLNGQSSSVLQVNLPHRTLSLPAFSGMGGYANQPKHVCVPDVGAIPKGAYYIVDRESGGRLGWLKELTQRSKSTWFSLYALDDKIDDQTKCDQITRGQFRIHAKGSAGLSKGCITLHNQADFELLRRELKLFGSYAIPETGMNAYGMVVVK